MLRFCANLGFLFSEVPFLDRFDAAARAGFTGVEYASPYDYPGASLRSGTASPRRSITQRRSTASWST